MVSPFLSFLTEIDFISHVVHACNISCGERVPVQIQYEAECCLENILKRKTDMASTRSELSLYSDLNMLHGHRETHFLLHLHRRP